MAHTASPFLKRQEIALKDIMRRAGSVLLPFAAVLALVSTLDLVGPGMALTLFVIAAPCVGAVLLGAPDNALHRAFGKHIKAMALLVVAIVSLPAVFAILGEPQSISPSGGAGLAHLLAAPAFVALLGFIWAARAALFDEALPASLTGRFDAFGARLAPMTGAFCLGFCVAMPIWISFAAVDFPAALSDLEAVFERTLGFAAAVLPVAMAMAEAKNQDQEIT